MEYLTEEEILGVHEEVLYEHGGAVGILRPDFISFVASQVGQSFGGVEIYPTIFNKAALYLVKISQGHGFTDGNKRTSIALAGIFLEKNGYSLNPPEGAIETSVIRVVEERLEIDEVSEWLESHSVLIEA